jgi:hypothetical protein
MRLVDTTARGDFGAEQALPGRAHYFVGNDPSGWRTNLPTFGRVAEREVYRGIDVANYGANGDVEYDFIVHPGADTRDMRLAFEGVLGRTLEHSGDLRVRTATGDVRVKAPVAYQDVGGTRRRCFTRRFSAVQAWMAPVRWRSIQVATHTFWAMRALGSRLRAHPFRHRRWGDSERFVAKVNAAGSVLHPAR